MLVENPLFYGGGEIHAYEVSKNLVKLGHTVDFIQLYGFPRKRELRPPKELSPSRWASPPKSRFANSIHVRILWFYSFLTIPSVTRELLKGKYDIVHVHDGGYSSPLFSAVIAKKINHSKIFCTLHNDLARHIDHKLIQISSQYVDRFIAVSPAIQKRWREVYNSESVLIPNGVDSSRFNSNVDGSSIRKRLGIENKYVVLSLGRLSSQKGLNYLIQAVTSLKKDIPNLVVLICGRGEEEDYLKRMVKDLDLNGIIKFLGYVPSEELPTYYAACDVFVLPSIFETFALTLLEALSVGKPVVCTKVGGAQELAIQFENSNFSRLVEPADSDDLAKGILWYFNHPKFSSINKRTVDEKLKIYSWESISAKINSLYEGLSTSK
jgi:glycosyltransferase involved in cell wall biosynthesis